MKCRYKKKIRYIQLDVNKNMQGVINFAGGDPADINNYTKRGVLVDTVDGKVELKHGDFLVDLFGIRGMTPSDFYENFEI